MAGDRVRIREGLELRLRSGLRIRGRVGLALGDNMTWRRVDYKSRTNRHIRDPIAISPPSYPREVVINR